MFLPREHIDRVVENLWPETHPGRDAGWVAWHRLLCLRAALIDCIIDEGCDAGLDENKEKQMTEA